MTYRSLTIPEYAMELRWTKSELLLFDQLHHRPLLKDKFEFKTIKDVVPVKGEFNRFHIKFRFGRNQFLHVDLARQKDILNTKAEYVLDFCMKTPNHGFYIGLYEIGEFKLTSSGRFHSIKTHSIQYVSRGYVTIDNHIYLGLRESETLNGPHTYYLVVIDWNHHPPKLIWKEKRESAITSIYSHSKVLFLGFRDGSFEIWNPTEKRVIISAPLFDQYTVFSSGCEKLLACSFSGEIAILDFKGNIHWLKNLSDCAIHAMSEDSRGIHVVDEQGQYFLIAPESGEVLTTDLWGQRIFSNLIIERDWILGAGVSGVHGRWIKDTSKIFLAHFIDPLVRKVISHPRGFLTGDDAGKVRFWKFGKLETHSYFHNRPPLYE